MYFSPNLLVQLIYRYSGHDDIYRLSNISNANVDVFANDYRNIIYNQFLTGWNNKMLNLGTFCNV